MFCSPPSCEKQCRHKAKSSCTQNENKDTSLPSGSSLAHTTITIIPPPLVRIELSADNCLRSELSCFPLDGANGPLTMASLSLRPTPPTSLLIITPRATALPATLVEVAAVGSRGRGRTTDETVCFSKSVCSRGFPQLVLWTPEDAIL